MSVFRRRLMGASVKEEEDPMEAMYLTFEALEDGFQITKSGQDQYAARGGEGYGREHQRCHEPHRYGCDSSMARTGR